MKIFYLNCFRLLKNNKKGQRDWPIDYAVSDELLGDGDADVLADYGKGTMVSMRFEGKDYEIVCVHIQHKKSKTQRLTKGNAFYEYGLCTLLDHMVKNEPIAVFGDFNNYPNDKSFLALSDNTGYSNAHIGDVRYTYKKTPMMRVR